jgi:hypothetical protein
MEPRVRLKRTYDYTYVQYKTGLFWRYLRYPNRDSFGDKMRWSPLDYKATMWAEDKLRQLRKEARQAKERKRFRVVYEEITLGTDV